MSLARVAAVVALGVATALALRFGRGHPWYMAGIAGFAVAMLSGMFLRTWDQLVRAWRPRGEEPPEGPDPPDDSAGR